MSQELQSSLCVGLIVVASHKGDGEGNSVDVVGCDDGGCSKVACVEDKNESGNGDKI